MATQLPALIPTEVFANYLKAASDPNLTIVIISGDIGKLEYELKYDYGIHNMILIKPEPADEDYPVQGKYLAPDYTTVADCLNANPELKNNCIVFLLWTSTTLTYDIEAINILEPIAVVLFYEVRGCAGSDALHSWLSKENIYNCYAHTPEKHNWFAKWKHLYPKQKFDKVSVYMAKEDTGPFGVILHPTLLWAHRRKMPINRILRRALPTVEYPCKRRILYE